MSRVVVLDGYATVAGDLDWSALHALFPGEVTVYERTLPGEVVGRAAGAELVLTNKVPLTAAMMECLPQLRYIGVLATGVNIVDVEAAAARGIVVTNVPAYSTPSVAQLAIAHLLNITNAVAQYAVEARQGAWSRSPDFSYLSVPVMELAGKVMGIVGYGAIGARVADIALALGMRVVALTSKPQSSLPAGVTRAEDLDALLATADVVSLHCPLTASTRGMIGERELRLMKPTAILLNTARGPLVDEQALADALSQGRLLAAGLDVMTLEPPREDNPLLREPRCFVTPHIGWASRESRERLMATTVANVEAYLAGAPVNVVAG